MSEHGFAPSARAPDGTPALRPCHAKVGSARRVEQAEEVKDSLKQANRRPLVVAVVALAATYAPARRAERVDPRAALAAD